MHRAYGSHGGQSWTEDGNGHVDSYREPLVAQLGSGLRQRIKRRCERSLPTYLRGQTNLRHLAPALQDNPF